jgi:hypothetical protein
MWVNLGSFLVALLFGVVGYYLCLIAKFYRLKFKRGPEMGWMAGFLGLLLAGLLMQSGLSAFLPGWLPALIVCSGGLGFSLLAIHLYRTMMSV